MVDEILADVASRVLAKSLEGTSKRQQALSRNIANAETPDYVREDVEFLSSLRTAVESTIDHPDRAKDVDDVAVRRVADFARPVDANGNNVDIEHEMAELARNSLEFEASARMLSLKMRMLRAAISEGRK